MIAIVFAVFVICAFVKALIGRTKVGQGPSGLEMRNLIPGLVVTLIYAFWAAKDLGIYTATA